VLVAISKEKNKGKKAAGGIHNEDDDGGGGASDQPAAAPDIAPQTGGATDNEEGTAAGASPLGAQHALGLNTGTEKPEAAAVLPTTTGAVDPMPYKDRSSPIGNMPATTSGDQTTEQAQYTTGSDQADRAQGLGLREGIGMHRVGREAEYESVHTMSAEENTENVAPAAVAPSKTLGMLQPEGQQQEGGQKRIQSSPGLSAHKKPRTADTAPYDVPVAASGAHFGGA